MRWFRGEERRKEENEQRSSCSLLTTPPANEGFCVTTAVQAKGSAEETCDKRDEGLLSERCFYWSVGKRRRG